MERTFVAIKPDGVKRGLIGKIIERFEDKGYKIVGLKMLHPTCEMATEHYKEHVGKPFYAGLITYITSGPIIAMAIEGQNAVANIRKVLGATKPEEAEMGSIRADFAQTMDFNIIHGADSVLSAEREINIYFQPHEICTNWQNMLEVLTQ